MREQITTFPVRDAFDPKQGCPFCRMRTLLEERFLHHILGDAMMEPSIRIQTNQKGFCRTHYQKMLNRNNRLSLALMLESHLKHLLHQKHLPPPTTNPLSELRSILRLFGQGKSALPSTSCYLCEKIDASLAQMLDTTLRHYEKDVNFRTLFAAQEQICLHHFVQWRAALLDHHPPRDKTVRAAIISESDRLCRAGIAAALDGVSSFCKMFDYRNASGESSAPRDAMERAIATLTGIE